jgi:transportin-1
MHAQDPQNYEEPDKDFMVVGLDLLSGVTQGLGSDSESLIVNIQPSALHLMVLCMKDPTADVQQSAYAFLGDIAISAFGLLKPQIDQIIPEVIKEITPEVQASRSSVTNNAIWAVGEIALRHQSGMEPFIQPLMLRLVPLLNTTRITRSISENAAITLGRLGLICPNPIAQEVGSFIQPWCTCLRAIRDNMEKETAFRGLVRVCTVNPGSVIPHLVYLCDAILHWQRPSPSLNELFKQVIYKTYIRL